MRVCIAVPPIRDFYATFHRISCLGSTVIARLVRKSGHDPVPFTFPLTSKQRGAAIPLPEHLSYLKGYIIPEERGPVAFFTHYKRFGPDFSVCADRIAGEQPDLLFISNFAFCYADDALLMASEVKKRLPELPVAVGGGGPSSYPEYFFKQKDEGRPRRESDYPVDFVFTGEAEVSIPLFLAQFTSHAPDFSRVPNLYYRDGPSPGTRFSNSIGLHTPSVFRWSREDDLDFVWAVTKETKKYRSIATSLTRGCPRRCAFCSVHLTHGKQFRTTPLRKIEEGIERIPGDKILQVDFEDDNLLADRDYFLAVLHLFRERFPDITFVAENGIDYTLLSPQIVRELRRLGFRKLNLTLASVDGMALSGQHRELDKTAYEAVLEAAAEACMPVVTYIIPGLENDTPSSSVTALVYLSALPTSVGISLFYPVPGLPKFEDKTVFDDFPSSRTASSSAYPWNRTHTTEELVTLFRLSRTVNFLKNRDAVGRYPALAEAIVRERRLFTLVPSSREAELSVVPVTGVSSALAESFFSQILTIVRSDRSIESDQ